jgi:hypothetical protein
MPEQKGPLKAKRAADGDPRLLDPETLDKTSDFREGNG